MKTWLNYVFLTTIGEKYRRRFLEVCVTRLTTACRLVLQFCISDRVELDSEGQCNRSCKLQIRFIVLHHGLDCFAIFREMNFNARYPDVWV